MIYVPSAKPNLKTLQQATLYFADPQNCIDYVARERWTDGVIICPNCGCTDITFLPTRQLFQCKNRHQKRQFSVKVGTIFEDSPLPLSKWLLIMWMLMNCRNGISSYEVARTIGITQKSAWFMLHRLRAAMDAEHEPLEGIIEADETYIGARLKNKHIRKLKQAKYNDKRPVFGMIERGGRVIAQVVPDTKSKTLLPIIVANIAQKSVVISDEAAAYDNVRWSGQSYRHHRINHAGGNYVNGPVHTNTIENFWSCLKRTLHGTYIAVAPSHLMAYVIEQAFRFNHRRNFTEEQRFAAVLQGTTGKRLTYAELTARTA